VALAALQSTGSPAGASRSRRAAASLTPERRRAPQGDVLEISAGTGRNLPYYRYGDIASLTLADISEPMLKRAEHKYFDELQV
jgi:ubiquinone/menaquinone biosynthesis C-methylase UbiE